MKRIFGFLFLLLTFNVSAESAKSLAAEAAKKSTVKESISYLEANISKLTQAADRRSAFAFLGSVQEQAGLYSQAGKSYAKAAAIAAGDAEGMPAKSSEQLVLDCVRCALCEGDYSSAESYLKSSVKDSKNQTVQAYIKLYEQWALLCKAETVEQTNAPLSKLKEYADLDSMTCVKPSILLTLWHLTGSASYSDKLKKNFPDSFEAGIVKGTIQEIPAPFWYFLPGKGKEVPDVNEVSSKSQVSSESAKSESNNAKKSSDSSSSVSSASSAKIIRQQLGLFREESNAKKLMDQVKAKGFDAKIMTEKRPSGTVYYIVTVDENKENSIGKELRNAGFECYPVLE